MTSFEGLFLTAHILAILGFITLGLTGNIGTVLLIISLVAASFSLYGHYSNRDICLPSGYSTALSAIVISYLTGSYFLMDTELFDLLIRFLVFVQIVKLSGKKGISDYRQIIILSFFQFLSVSVSTTGMFYGVISIAFLVLTTAGIMLYNICSESSKFNEQDNEIVVRTQFLKILIPAFLLTLVFTTIIFISMPRFRRSFITASMIKSNEIRSGYSDEITLGQVGRIKKDNTPVMSVKILNQTGSGPVKNIYWRGATLNEFNGITWRTGNKKRKIRYEDSDGLIILSTKESPDIIKQEIITEPLDSDILFAADIPVAYQNVPFNRLKELNDTQYVYSSAVSKKKYIAYSKLRTNNKTEIKKSEEDYPAHIVKSHLKNIYRTEAIKEMARELYESSSTKYRNVLKVKNYLRKNYEYTRTLENTGPAFPVEDFLTNRKKGHCEYFATSMVVILQNMGIPARLVTGFLGGDYNEKGDFYIVREHHAHAWVEAYFNTAGWVRFDPTPVGNDERQQDSYLTSYIEFLKYRWNRYVVDYDRSDQKVLMDRFRNNIDRSVFNFYAIKEYAKNNLTELTVFVSLIFAFYTVYSRRNKFGVLLYYGDGQNRAAEAYSKGLDILKKRGVKKAPYMTPSEFSLFLTGNCYREADPFSRLTWLYLETRYGSKPDEEKIREMKGIIKEIRESWDK